MQPMTLDKLVRRLAHNQKREFSVQFPRGMIGQANVTSTGLLYVRATQDVLRYDVVSGLVAGMQASSDDKLDLWGGRFSYMVELPSFEMSRGEFRDLDVVGLSAGEKDRFVAVQGSVNPPVIVGSAHRNVALVFGGTGKYRGVLSELADEFDRVVLAMVMYKKKYTKVHKRSANAAIGEYLRELAPYFAMRNGERKKLPSSPLVFHLPDEGVQQVVRRSNGYVELPYDLLADFPEERRRVLTSEGQNRVVGVINWYPSRLEDKNVYLGDLKKVESKIRGAMRFGIASGTGAVLGGRNIPEGARMRSFSYQDGDHLIKYWVETSGKTRLEMRVDVRRPVLMADQQFVCDHLGLQFFA